MKIHALALGTGDNVKNLDETSSLLLEQRVRCTDQWVRVPGFRDVAWEPVWFLSELPRNLQEGDEICQDCVRAVQADHHRALVMGYGALNALADLEKRT